MKFKALLFICACLFGASSTQALAEQINTKAKANKKTQIYIYGRYNPDNCGSMGVPKFKVRRVDNGKIVGVRKRFTLRRGKCAGKSIQGIAFLYTSKGGFRGYDKARVTLTFPTFVDDSGHGAHTLNFTIDVR